MSTAIERVNLHATVESTRTSAVMAAIRIADAVADGWGTNPLMVAQYKLAKEAHGRVYDKLVEANK